MDVSLNENNAKIFVTAFVQVEIADDAYNKKVTKMTVTIYYNNQ